MLSFYESQFALCYALTNQNFMSVEFFSNSFVIKDIRAKWVLYQDQNNNGLYLMPLSSTLAAQPLLMLWNLGLGMLVWHTPIIVLLIMFFPKIIKLSIKMSLFICLVMLVILARLISYRLWILILLFLDL